MAAINRDVQFDFRETVEPVYRELVRLLLPPLTEEKGQAVARENLQQARELIESLQLASLDNFFREACLDASSRAIDSDRPQGDGYLSDDIKRSLSGDCLLSRSAPALLCCPGYDPSSQTQIENTLKEFIIRLSPLYDEEDCLRLSQTVYDWLLRLAEAAGALAGTETEFYQQLQTPGVTKAAAMGRAQLALLADPEYSEPFF